MDLQSILGEATDCLMMRSWNMYQNSSNRVQHVMLLGRWSTSVTLTLSNQFPKHTFILL